MPYGFRYVNEMMMIITLNDMIEWLGYKWIECKNFAAIQRQFCFFVCNDIRYVIHWYLFDLQSIGKTHRNEKRHTKHVQFMNVFSFLFVPLEFEQWKKWRRKTTTRRGWAQFKFWNFAFSAIGRIFIESFSWRYFFFFQFGVRFGWQWKHRWKWINIP